VESSRDRAKATKKGAAAPREKRGESSKRMGNSRESLLRVEKVPGSEKRVGYPRRGKPGKNTGPPKDEN